MDFHPVADHMTKLRNFTKGENYFSAFRFSLHFNYHVAVDTMNVCFSQNLFEMRLAKNRIEEAPLTRFNNI